jgi:hypothetical protein
MVTAWVLTLPAAAMVGAAAAWVAFTGVVGTVIVALTLVAAAAGIYVASRRRPVNGHNAGRRRAHPEPGRRIRGRRALPARDGGDRRLRPVDHRGVSLA